MENINNTKEGIKFMNVSNRRLLYTVTGFIGGLIFMNMLLPTDTYNRTLFTIIGGIIVAIVGYKIATH